MVTRHILEQTRRNGDDLASVRTRLDRVETRLDGVETEVRGLRHSITDLVKNLPQIVGDAVKDALAERRRKR